jgi:hypothetical protein
MFTPGWYAGNTPSSWRGLPPQAIFSPTMVRVPGQYGDSPINLFQQQDTDDLVGPSYLTEGDAKVGTFEQTWRKPVRSADNADCRGPCLLPPQLQLGGKGRAVQVFAFRIQHENGGLFRDHGGERNGLLEHPPPRIVGPALPDFNNLDLTQTETTAGLLGALAVTFSEFAFGSLFQPANGSNEEPHGRKI